MAPASSQALEIRWDQEIEALPTDRAVWLLGWENRFLPEVTTALTLLRCRAHPRKRAPEGTPLTRVQHVVVLTCVTLKTPNRRWPGSPPRTSPLCLGWDGSCRTTAPTAFWVSQEMNRSISSKVQWPVLASPLSVLLTPATGSPPQEAATQLAPRPPLISLP